MLFIQIFIVISTILLLWNIILTLKIRNGATNTEFTELSSSITSILAKIKDSETNLKSEFVTNRKESSNTAKDLRERYQIN